MKTLLAFLLLCTTAYAQPTPVIEGPKDARPGDIVLLDASGSNAKFYTWAVDLSGVDVPEDGGPDLSDLADALREQGFEVTEPATDDGRPAYLVLGETGARLQLSSYPGVYRVTMACSDDTGVALASHEVTVKGTKPPVPPDPPKPDPPDPDPVPLPTLTKLVRDAVQDAGGDADEWTQLAGVYEALSIAFSVEDSDDVSGAIDMTKEITHTVLSENLAAWQEITGQTLGPYLNEQLAKGKIPDVKACSGIWKQIAEGIREGAK